MSKGTETPTTQGTALEYNEKLSKLLAELAGAESLHGIASVEAMRLREEFVKHVQSRFPSATEATQEIAFFYEHRISEVQGTRPKDWHYPLAILKLELCQWLAQHQPEDLEYVRDTCDEILPLLEEASARGLIASSCPAAAARILADCCCQGSCHMYGTAKGLYAKAIVLYGPGHTLLDSLRAKIQECNEKLRARASEVHNDHLH